MRATKELRAVVGEIIALVGVIHVAFPGLCRAEILGIIAGDGTPEGSARQLVNAHLRQVRRGSGAGSILGPTSH